MSKALTKKEGRILRRFETDVRAHREEYREAGRWLNARYGEEALRKAQADRWRATLEQVEAGGGLGPGAK